MYSKKLLKTKKLLKKELDKHGEEVFGDKKLFTEWLNKRNFYFEKKAPKQFLSTISGIKFIDDRLTGMQYGDNA